MPTNVFLVRWKDGWHEVVDPASLAAHPRHEAFLALGSLQSIPEVDRVAGMQLSVVAYPRAAIAADHDPMSVADRPYRSYNVGDIITVPDYGSGKSGQRVRSISGAEDDDGEVTYSPELGDLILEEQERMLLAVKKMSDGTLEGESAVAQPTRVYVSPIVARPIPKVKTGILRFVSTQPQSPLYQSAVSDTMSWPLQTVTLDSFRVTPSLSGPHDGSSTRFRVIHILSGEGEVTLAEADIGHDYIGGTTYTGTIWEPNALLGGNNAIAFQVFYANPTGSTYVEAIFTEPGGTYTLAWGST